MPNRWESFVNSIGMTFAPIKSGTFFMGQADGEHDEHPVHKVNITKDFYIGITEVTNRQYEQFDPGHVRFRGEKGFSADNDDAVIYVSWHDAQNFCKWLTEKEGIPYRLPTEAEWEYVCRAGTTAHYNTGDTLPTVYCKNQEEQRTPVPVSLKVGQTPENNFGIYDMHGNVEEWCCDWYGPYVGGEQTDPVGYESGDFKVSRGGSHNTDVYYLRSAARMGTLPEDRHWLIGFRVVMGELPCSAPLARSQRPLWSVTADKPDHPWDTKKGQAYFEGPIPYIIPSDDPGSIPFYPHNHCASITWCDNGDLLAIWFSCKRERGREMTILASRLRAGSDSWDTASEFFGAPGRNMTGSSLLNDRKGRLFHFNGLEAAGCWANLALVMRTSTDSGASWSKPKLINPNHRPRNQVISGASMTDDGIIIQPCDAVSGGAGGSTIHLSGDGGETWVEHSFGKPDPEFIEGGSGAIIAGIHAGVVSLKDGSLMAFGRENNIDGRMPKSISKDMGKTWTYHASEFPPISGGQRLILLRLNEGALLFVSFTEDSSLHRNHEYGGSESENKYLFDDKEKMSGLLVEDDSGKPVRVYGMFAALSFDEGATWPVKKLLSPGGCTQVLDGGGHTRRFTMSRTQAEPMGYLAATQSPDGIIHVISSRLHYRFNLEWLKKPMEVE